MSDLITITDAGPVASLPASLPVPRVPISVRAATPDDVPFMDRLQKLHGKQVGWMPTATLEGKIRLGHVLVAEATGRDEGGGMRDEGDISSSSLIPPPSSLRLGYVIGNDRYFKRDDVGIVYQMNVDPSAQRGFVGATLLRALFDRAAYGCRLFCCWCAQDIAANRFWEAMGFVPLAFRAGSTSKDRTHIFWQKRIREGDASTPWWFPAKTDGGAMRADRLVLPIPPGVRWHDEMPRLTPTEPVALMEPAALADAGVKPTAKRRTKPIVAPPPPPAPPRVRRGIQFGVPGDEATAFAPPPMPPVPVVVEAPAEKPKRKIAKCDPKHVAMARELRDRWLEQVNSAGFALPHAAKYVVHRAIVDRREDGRVSVSNREPLALPTPIAA